MELRIYLADDTTPATSRVFSSAAGVQSAAQTYHVWANKGTSSGTATNVSLMVRVEDPLNPGTWLTSGVEPLDDAWFRVRVVGSANPSSHSEFVMAGTAWTPLGAARRLWLGTMLGDTCAYVEVAIRPPARPGANPSPFNWALEAVYDEELLPLPHGLAESATGIVTSVGDGARTTFVERVTVTASGPPDAKVRVDQRWFVFSGISRRAAGADVTLNQVDGDAVTLTVGKEYKALLYQEEAGGAPTVLKGSMANTGLSVPPILGATPGIPICLVVVTYQAGGTSVIAQGQITVLTIGDRFEPVIGTGLTIKVGAGTALLGSALLRRDYESTVTLTTASTEYVYLTTAGIVVQATDVPPEAGAVPICKTVTGVATVTSVTDRRRFYEPHAENLCLRYLDTEPRQFEYDRTYRELVSIAAAAFTDSSNLIPADSQVLSVSTEWKVQPGGTTTCDVGVAGATTRYATAVSTVATTKSAGLADGVRYYGTATAIRLTPNAVPSDALGRVWVEVRVRTILPLDNPLDSLMIGYRANLDRVVGTVMFPSGGGATGQTVLDVRRVNAGVQASIFAASGNACLIAAGSTVMDPTSGKPDVTLFEVGDWLRLTCIETTDGGSPPRNMGVSLILYRR